MIYRFMRLVTGVALAALAACGGSSGQGDMPGRGEWIVYSLSPTVQTAGTMFRIRPNATEKLAITDQGRPGDPAFSSDGNTIVFSTSRDSPNPAGFGAPTHLYKADINGAVQTRVTTNSLSCVELHGHFSADDRMITFVMTCDNPTAWRVYRINADGSGQVQVVSDHPALAARHSEDFSAFVSNGRIAFTADFGGDDLGNPQPPSVDLLVMDADGKNTQRLTNVALEGRTITDHPSVLGNSIYFVTHPANRGNAGRLEVINADGTGRMIVYQIPDVAVPGGASLDSQFAIAPSGRSMAFVRNDLAGTAMLMTAAIDGSGATVIDASGIPGTPAWK